MTESGARASFSIQPYPVQHPCRPPEYLRLHVRIGLRGKTHIRVPRQLLDFERIFGLVTENLFARGLRPAVTSCHKLAFPVHLTGDLTG